MPDAPPEPDEAAVQALAEGSHVSVDGMTVIIAGRYDSPDLHLTGGVNWEIALDPSGGKDDDAIVYVNCRDLLDAVILALADTGDTYTAGYVAPDDHARQLRDARQEGAEAALEELRQVWTFVPAAYPTATPVLPEMGSGDRARKIAAVSPDLILVTRRVTDWQAADDG